MCRYHGNGVVQVTTKTIRATLNIGMVCQTIAHRPVDAGKESELSRDDISCRIIYAANGKDTVKLNVWV